MIARPIVHLTITGSICYTLITCIWILNSIIIPLIQNILEMKCYTRRLGLCNYQYYNTHKSKPFIHIILQRDNRIDVCILFKSPSSQRQIDLEISLVYSSLFMPRRGFDPWNQWSRARRHIHETSYPHQKYNITFFAYYHPKMLFQSVHNFFKSNTF